MPERPDVVVFEVLETLIDLDPLGGGMAGKGGPAGGPARALVHALSTRCHGVDPCRLCARLEQKPGDGCLPADVTGESLVEVADKLVALH